MMNINIHARTAMAGAMFAAALLLVPSQVLGGAKITIINADGPNEGFNDPTPAAPVGGNTGTTLGQQRRIAFQHAANLWGLALDSNVEIFVQASFDPLGTNVLGSAGPTFVFSDFASTGSFPGPEYADTWYVSALADKRAGTDVGVPAGLPAGTPDVAARFSSNFPFYLGLDNQHGPQNDLVTVVLHELGHGMGFLTLMNRQNGSYFQNRVDVFTRFVYDDSVDSLWIDLKNKPERAASVLRVDRIGWAGPEARAATDNVLSFGRPELTYLQPASLGGTVVRVGTASFGPQLSPTGLTGDVVLGLDGTSPATDACQALTNGASIAGKIALVDRGTCNFTVKVANAQAVGAIAVLVADNVADDPPPGLGGSDPSIAIPSVRITLAQGNAIKSALGSGTTVRVTLGLDTTQLAGGLPSGEPQLYASNPIIGGSSISHWDPIAFRNQLMEPAINPDLTHSLIPPQDLTLMHFRDLGWFLDGDLNGAEDTTVILGTCDSGVPNVLLPSGATLADAARACGSAKNSGQFVSCVGSAANQAMDAGLISEAQKDALMACASGGTQ